MARAKFPRDILGPDGVISKKLPGYESREEQMEMADQVAYAIDNNENTVVEAGTGTGKALDVKTPIATPLGWTAMGELKVGDIVFDEHGEQTKVTTVFDVMHGRRCYEIMFSDGSSLVADAEHEWVVSNANDRKHKDSRSRIVTTEQMTIAPRVHTDNRLNYAVALAEPLETVDTDLPIDPYLLGMWLSDGACARASITIADSDIVQMISDRYSVHGVDEWGKNRFKRGLLGVFRDLDLIENKHIPMLYKRASVSQRRELLAGLLGGDGYASKSGVQYSSSTPQLIADVYELVASLGYRPSVFSKISTLDGVEHKRSYTVGFSTNNSVFYCERKNAMHVTRPTNYASARNLYRYVTSVIEVESRPVRCISVDSPNHMYLAGKALIPTHNSLAYLVPAILSGKQTIVSTGDKALQQQLIGKDLPFLHKVMPQPFTSSLLKGKGNYACLQNVSVAGSYMDVPTEFKAWLDTTPDGDLDKYNGDMTMALRMAVSIDSESCLGDKCPFYTDCWAEIAKTNARQSNIIVVNHALLMADLALRSMSGGKASVLPTSAEVIVIDEAHNLENAAVDAFGIDVSQKRWNSIAGALARLARRQSQSSAEKWNNELAAVAINVNNVFNTIKQRVLASKKPSMNLGDEAILAFPSITGLRRMTSRMKSWAPTNLSTADRTAWEKMQNRILNFAADLETTTTPKDDDSWIRYGGIEGTGRTAQVVLSAKPVNVAPILRRHLFDAGFTVISTSATLAIGKDINYWRSRVGMDQNSELVLSSPFDYYKNGLIYTPADGNLFDSSQYRNEGTTGYLDRLAAEIQQLLVASHGRAFVLFTSNNVMNETYQRLSPRLRDFLVLKQGDLPRPELIRQFKADGNAVLFGVKSFWEGVDVAGENLSLVIIDKLPFPPPDDPVWAAKCNSMNILRNDKWAWFNGLAIPTVTIAMKQGVGRLIRSKSDRGVVAILDGRVRNKPYGAKIIKALPPMQQTSSIEAVRAFFEQENS